MYLYCLIGKYKKWHILTIHDLIKLNLAKFAFECTYNILPKSLLQLCRPSTKHNYYTRGCNLPRAEVHRSHIYNSSFLNKAPAVIQSHLSLIHGSVSVKAFSKSLTATLLNKY